MKESIAERFLRDVANHQMTIVRTDGVFRHVRFRQPGTSNMGFDVITWPWHLCYSGDMGTFVFSRLEDMFEFFRGHRPNLSYWAEKLQAVDRTDGFERFSPAAFRENVADLVREFLSRNPDVDAKELWNDVGVEVFSAAEDGQVRAFDAASDWCHSSGFQIRDFWDFNCDEYTLRFQWCCHALPWAIAQYDAAQPATPATATEAAL